MSEAEEYEPPLFEAPPPRHRKPVATDGVGRALVRCGTGGPYAAYVDVEDRVGRDRSAPRCNRVAGHEGPHRQVSRRSFGTEAEWE